MEQPTNQDIMNKLLQVEMKMDKIEPIVDAYDSVLLGKKFLIGIGGFVAAMVGLGAGILWLASFIRHIFP